MMFDATACGEYKSFNNSHLGQSQPCGEDDDDDDDEGEEDDGRLLDLEKLCLSSCNLTSISVFDIGGQFLNLTSCACFNLQDQQDPHENTMSQSNRHKAR